MCNVGQRRSPREPLAVQAALASFSSGFGTFTVRSRAARTGRNPRTNEEIKIPASKVPAFKAGKALKDHLN